MHQQFDALQPFKTIINQIEDSIKYAAASKAAYTPSQVLNIAYSSVFQTGMFPEACHEWHRKDVANKTWATFKTYFADIHQELCESQITTQIGGYYAANIALEIAKEALVDLAAATQSDQATIAMLTDMNATLLA